METGVRGAFGSSVGGVACATLYGKVHTWVSRGNLHVLAVALGSIIAKARCGPLLAAETLGLGYRLVVGRIS